MLNEQQVVQIYMAKLAMQAQNRDHIPITNRMQAIKGQSVSVSVLYGVTSRTIRDIWNRRSWAYATRHLWHLEPQPGAADESSMPAEKVPPFLFMISSLHGGLSRDIDYVNLCSKVSRWTFAVLDGPRDPATGLHGNQMRDRIRRSGTVAHRWTRRSAQRGYDTAMIGFMSWRK